MKSTTYEELIDEHYPPGSETRRVYEEELCKQHTSIAIRNAREAAGLSLQGLGDKLGVTRQSVHKWESGEVSIGVLTLHKIATALNKKLVIQFEDYV